MLENLEFSSQKWMFLLPLIFMTIDCVLGFGIAASEKKLSSAIMFKGLLKKVASMSIVIISAAMISAFGLPEQICGAASIYICGMELTSVLTNLKSFGINVDNHIDDILSKEGDDKNA